MRFFADQKVNKGRQPELDYLKALCIFLMIFLHIYEDCSDYTGVLHQIVNIMCLLLGAAAFMICMGIGMRYSRHQEAKEYVLRGFELLTVGQFLNLLRNALPNLIAWWATGKQFFIANAMLVLQADILTFAGIAFMLIALFKKLKVPDVWILIIGFAMNIVAYPLFKSMKSPDNFLLSQLLGYFVLTNAESYFPLLSYFVFVAFGYWLGGLYPRIADKDGLANRVLLICLPIVIIYYLLRIFVPFPLMPVYDTYEHYILCTGPDAVATIMASLAALALFHKLSVRTGGKTPKIVDHVSRNINLYYIISYLFTVPMQTILLATSGKLMSGWLLPTAYSLLVFFLCKILIDFNDRYTHITITKLKNPKRAVVFTIIWILTIACVIYVYPKVETFATFWNNYLL